MHITGSYRCLARDRGYHQCEQGYVPVSLIDEQVVEALSNLFIPVGFQERVEEAIQQRVEHADALQRMADLEEIVQRIDFSWEQGFLSPQEYVSKRQELKQEMESLRPVEYDDLMEAADLLENFWTYWDGCDNVGNPEEARRQLLAKIVDRVFVYDQHVLAVALHGDFSIVLDNGTSAPNEIVEGLKMEIAEGKEKGASESGSTCTLDGSDGLWVITCTVLILRLPLFPITSSPESTCLLGKQNSSSIEIRNRPPVELFSYGIWFWVWLQVTVGFCSESLIIPEAEYL